MLLKNFIVELAAGVAAPITSWPSNPFYLKATDGTACQIKYGDANSINSVSGSVYSNTKGTDGMSGFGNYKGIALGTGTTPPYLQ